MKWSIRRKFLLVMSSLLSVCLGIYLLMAVTVFKSDKTQLVFDLNRSQVSNLASEIETQLGGVSEKLKLFAQLPSGQQAKMANDLFSDDSEVVAVAIFKVDGDKPIRSFTQKKFLETYGLAEESFQGVFSLNSIPLAGILRNGQEIWNGSQKNIPPLIGYGRLVVLEDERGVPVDQWAVIGYVKLDRFLKSVSIVRLSDVVIANRHGEVLVQREAEKLIEKPSLSEQLIFKNALSAKTRLSVTNLEFEGARWLAAHAKAFNNQVIVMAKAPEKEVFRVVRDLSVRTLLFGSIVLTLVILAAYMLSHSLTENIALLSERMESVSQGDLSTVIHLKGRDETVQLALTFNKMISDLRLSRDELEKMNRELDLKVKERTLQLEEQNQKVKEAQEALLRTTRMASVGEIAGRTAHEVLNPLTSLLTRASLMQKRATEDYQTQVQLLNDIRSAWQKDFSEGGFSQLVRSWQGSSQVDPNINLFEEDVANLGAIAVDLAKQSQSISVDTQFIREEGGRISKIINSMRRLGHVQSEAHAHSLHAILNDCCQIMADLFDQKNFKIEKDFSAAQDEVLVDRDEMVQAVTNLMRNSLQALEDVSRHGLLVKNPRMCVRTYLNGSQLVVELEDNGYGIAEEFQSRLFNSSFTTKSSEEGTGLGLGISRRFIRSYGGDIQFISSVSCEKTLFRIQMPLKKSSGVAA